MRTSYEPLLVEFEVMKKSITDWGSLALMLRFVACERLLNSGMARAEGGMLGASVAEREMRSVARELAELLAGSVKGQTLPLRTASGRDDFGELERRVAALEAFVHAVKAPEFEGSGANE
jgi:hypothetical protein